MLKIIERQEDDGNSRLAVAGNMVARLPGKERRAARALQIEPTIVKNCMKLAIWIFSDESVLMLRLSSSLCLGTNLKLQVFLARGGGSLVLSSK